MRKWLLLTTILAFSSTSLAQKIKVRKVKGNQAVVEFSGASLRPGQVYELTQDEFAESSGIGSGNRKYVVGIKFDLLSAKSDADSTNQTSMNFQGQFGWNFGDFELGPLFNYASADSGSQTITTYKLGGFGDYNMISNVGGEPFIYGVGGTAAIGQRDSGGSAKLDLMDFFVGPFMKWFPGGGDVGFRADVGYFYQTQSGGSSTVTYSGLGINAGLIGYF